MPERIDLTRSSHRVALAKLDFACAFAMLRLSMLNGSDIVELSNTWLNNGHYCDELVEIYDMDNPPLHEVEIIFSNALEDLGVTKPTREQAALSLTQKTLEFIVAGQADPVEGSGFLYWQVHHEIDDEIPDGRYLGSNIGLEHVFGALRFYWDAEQDCSGKFQIAKRKLDCRNQIVTEARLWLESNH